jgi:hypothetical protein
MAHFALLNDKNIVIDVIVVDNKDILDSNGLESEEIGIKFCNLLKTGKWKQTSINKTFRKNFANINSSIYDEVRDAFVDNQPYPSWTLDEETCTWRAPIPNKYEEYLKEYKSLGASAFWDEENKNWIYRGPKIYSKEDLLKIQIPTAVDGTLPNTGYLNYTGIYPGD